MNINCEIRLIDENTGKGMFALRDIPEGTIIFEEDPLVCAQYSWNRAYKYSACDHCLKPLENVEENVRRLTANPNYVVPNLECCETDKSKHVACQACGISYCSEECLNLAFNQYHRTLCTQMFNAENHPLTILEEAWKVTHYPPETCAIMIIPRIIATIQQSANPNETLNNFFQFCHKTVNVNEAIVHRMVGEKFLGQIEDIRGLLCQAVNTAGVESLLSEEGFQTLLALIATNGQGVGTSPLAKWANKVLELPTDLQTKSKIDEYMDKLYNDIEEVSGMFLNSEGTALFYNQSACNHSCVNNAKVHYMHNNSRMSLIACKDIKANEEITISYLDECNLERSRHSRNKILSEFYLFTCKCPKCFQQKDDPDCTSSEEEEDEELDEEMD